MRGGFVKAIRFRRTDPHRLCRFLAEHDAFLTPFEPDESVCRAVDYLDGNDPRDHVFPGIGIGDQLPDALARRVNFFFYRDRDSERPLFYVVLLSQDRSAPTLSLVEIFPCWRRR
jgi:hypothetical protein